MAEWANARERKTGKLQGKACGSGPQGRIQPTQRGVTGRRFGPRPAASLVPGERQQQLSLGEHPPPFPLANEHR